MSKYAIVKRCLNNSISSIDKCQEELIELLKMALQIQAAANESAAMGLSIDLESYGAAIYATISKVVDQTEAAAFNMEHTKQKQFGHSDLALAAWQAALKTNASRLTKEGKA